MFFSVSHIILFYIYHASNRNFLTYF